MAFPTNPVNGQIYKQHIFNGSRWISLNGISLSSKYKLSKNYTHTAGIWEKIPFDLYDSGNLPITFDTTLNRFTAFNKGVYRATVTGYTTTNGSGTDPRYAIGIYKNGINMGFTGGNLGSTADTPLVGYSGLVTLNGTTDYFEICSFSAISILMCGSTYHEIGHEMLLFIEYLGDQP